MTIDQLHEVSDEDKGICGFVSMVQLLLDHRRITFEDFEKDYGSSTISFTKEWINIQVEHDSSVVDPSDGKKVATALRRSLLFTQDFKGFKDYKTENYLQDENWKGLALTPEAICDYLLRRYSLNMNIQYDFGQPKLDNFLKEDKEFRKDFHGIYGIKKCDKSEDYNVEHGQLSHYIYIDTEGNLMTWGYQNEDAKSKLSLKKYSSIVVRLYPS